MKLNVGTGDNLGLSKLKSDLRGIETGYCRSSEKVCIRLKSDLRGIETGS
ncbi:conserved hypothetical protein [Methanosarcina thermophila]|uniref:Uncharacterized protein n=1 Tax=Methanosarcina thermophila TaxID=2210 RepID=A0A3G9CSW8_METTE|nr:conserved hypothetical protein [Methanosarcina thermophila]